jgi:hypothetical protein
MLGVGVGVGHATLITQVFSCFFNACAFFYAPFFIQPEEKNSHNLGCSPRNSDPGNDVPRFAFSPEGVKISQPGLQRRD